MLPHFFNQPIAGVLGLGPFEVMIVIFIILLLMLALPVTMFVIAWEYKNRRQKQWHETARLALEKGQALPVPPSESFQPPSGGRPARSDIRTGLILMGVGIGLAAFFHGVGKREAMGIGAIPGFIGLALLIFGLFSHWTTPKQNHPPQT